MEQHQAKDFIQTNTEALKHLSKIIQKADSVRDCKDEIEMKARKRAIEIVEEWLTEVWGYSDEFPIPHYEEDEDLYKKLSAGRD